MILVKHGKLERICIVWTLMGLKPKDSQWGKKPQQFKTAGCLYNDSGVLAGYSHFFPHLKRGIIPQKSV